MFFKRLFSKKEQPVDEPMHGLPTLQTKEEQEATREHMVAAMAADRARRGATGEHPPAEESKDAPTDES